MSETKPAPWNPVVNLRTGPVRPGDTIVFFGQPHAVTSVDRLNGFGWPIADCANGWGIALNPDGTAPGLFPSERNCCIATGSAA